MLSLILSILFPVLVYRYGIDIDVRCELVIKRVAVYTQREREGKRERGQDNNMWYWPYVCCRQVHLQVQNSRVSTYLSGENVSLAPILGPLSLHLSSRSSGKAWNNPQRAQDQSSFGAGCG